MSAEELHQYLHAVLLVLTNTRHRKVLDEIVAKTTETNLFTAMEAASMKKVVKYLFEKASSTEDMLPKANRSTIYGMIQLISPNVSVSLMLLKLLGATCLAALLQ